MLKKRLITAAWALAILILFLWLGRPWLSFLFAFGALVSFHEFYKLGISDKALPPKIFGLLWTGLFVLSPLFRNPLALPVLITTAVVFSLLFNLRRSDTGLLREWAWNLAGIFYIGWFLSRYVALLDFDSGREFVTLILFTTFGCDTASYFIGKYFGKKKMYPRLSPGKTWEGSIAGFFASIASVFILSAFLKLGISFYHQIALGILIGIFAQLGDLVESMFKRGAGVKDAGIILPGHGGLLDRVDSMIFAGVVSYYYIMFVVL
ncbi:MAG: phosphatidate cytidylyltransferase [Dehalococcoidia bacterium]|nr:phosphatidate cytidylyltransferase [Dehalococcoidia bacterium]